MSTLVWIILGALFFGGSFWILFGMDIEKHEPHLKGMSDFLNACEKSVGEEEKKRK